MINVLMVFDISTSLKNLTEKCENITHFIYLTESLTEFWCYEFWRFWKQKKVVNTEGFVKLFRK